MLKNSVHPGINKLFIQQWLIKVKFSHLQSQFLFMVLNKINTFAETIHGLT